MLECVIGTREKKMACFALEPMMRSIISENINSHCVCVCDIEVCAKNELPIESIQQIKIGIKFYISLIYLRNSLFLHSIRIEYTLHTAHTHTQRAKWTYWFCCKNNDWDHWFGLPKTIYFALCYVETVNFKYTLNWNEMESTEFDFRTIEHLACSQP